MTTPSDPLSPVSDALLTLAARFRARLADAPCDAALRARIDAWKAEDPAHAQAFDEAERMWQLMGGSIAEMAPRRRHKRWLGGGAVAASIAAILLAVPAAERLWQDWRSDSVTSVGGRGDIVLADGTHVALNTDTALAYDADDGGRSVRLYRGEAYFAVARDPSRPFRIRAGDATVTVLGTHFNVRMADEAVIVDVEEGHVRLEGAGGAVDLTADERGRYADDHAAEHQAASSDATAWRRGRAVFYDAPLPVVVANLNRYRHGPIILVGSELRARRVSGTFRTDDAEALPEAVRKVLGARAFSVPGGLVFLY